MGGPERLSHLWEVTQHLVVGPSHCCLGKPLLSKERKERPPGSISHELPGVLTSGGMEGRGGRGLHSPGATALPPRKGLGLTIVHDPWALGLCVLCPYLVHPLPVTEGKLRHGQGVVQPCRVRPGAQASRGGAPWPFPHGLGNRDSCGFSLHSLSVVASSPRGRISLRPLPGADPVRTVEGQGMCES